MPAISINFAAKGAPRANRAVAALAALLVLGVAACAGPTYPPAPRDASSSDYEYVIGPLDTVNIIVWRNPELSMSVPVRPDGKMTTPLVDDLPALGKTPTAARPRHREGARQVHSRSGRHRRRHRRSSARRSEQIRVVGEAAKPQILPYRKKMTLLDVMIAVGGLTDFADGNKATHLPRRRQGQAVQRAPAGSRQARRHLGQRRHAARRHPDHSAELVLTCPNGIRAGSRQRLKSLMDELIQRVLAQSARHVAPPLDRPRGRLDRRRSSASTAAYRIPERYEASARVYVDTQSLLRP